MEDAVQGPGHVANKLIQYARNHPTESIDFNEEQLLVIALCIWPLEQAWRSRGKTLHTTSATVNTLHKLPNDLGLPRIVIIGGGGCGKTTIMQAVVVPTLRTFFQNGCAHCTLQSSRSWLRSQCKDSSLDYRNETARFYAHFQFAHKERSHEKAHGCQPNVCWGLGS